MVEQALSSDDTLWSVLETRAKYDGDRPAVIWRDGALSWSELRDRAIWAAEGFTALGLGPGDVISAQLPNVPEFLISFLGAARIGVVTNTIHMPYGPQEAADLMGHAESRAVVCTAEGAARLLPLKTELPRLDHVIAVSGDAPDGSINFDTLEPGAALPPPPKTDDPLILLFTSGTSASPKGVLASHHPYLANARLNYGEKHLTRDSVMMSAPPFTHLLGSYTFFLTLYAGAANLLLPAFSPPAFVETITCGRPSCIFTAPAHIAACEAGGLFPDDGFPSIEYAIISGSMAAPDLFRRFQERLPNGRVGQLWGMTELQCGLFTRPGDGLENAAKSCGRASTGTEIRIGDDSELQVRGVSVFEGYYRNDAASAAAFTEDGWFRTGDLAEIDADGFVSITGRDKDIINRGGVKINPADVEEAIDRHPSIVQSAIVPMPDDILGEKACCFAVATPGAPPDLATITDWLAEQGIAKLKWPERLVLVDELPLTPTRKVIKGRLQIP